MLGPQLVVVDRDYVVFENRKYLYFGGTDYHRFSSDPVIIDEVSNAAGKYGIGSSGSRTTTGNHRVYLELEEELAGFFGSEAALVLPSGFLSNTAVLEGLGGRVDRFFADEGAHASLLTAIRLAGKPAHFFRHLDPESLRRALREHLEPAEIPFVVTDGVFPSRGEVPPLKEYEAILAAYEGRILLDDSHAMGTLGHTGKGSWEQEGVSRESIHQTGTLSKGFGAFGGVIVDTMETIHSIKEASTVVCGSTGIPLPLAAAAMKSISILRARPELIRNLQEKALSFKMRLQEHGFDLPVFPSPIVSVTHFDRARNERLKEALLANDIYPPFINYPGSPAGGHFRFALSSHHTEAQIGLLFEVITSTV